MNLDDVLNGQEPEGEAVVEAPAVVETPPAEPAAAAAPSTPRDEQGRFAPKGDSQPAPAAAPAAAAPAAAAPPATPAAEAAPPAAETRTIPEGALIEERRRRQAAEDRLALLERQAQYGAQPPAHQQYQQPQQPALIPSIYEDENGFAVGLLERAAQTAREQLAPEFQREILAIRRDVHEEMAKSRYPDYDEKVAAFIEMAQGNPPLIHALANAPNAAEYAYGYAKNALEVQRIGSLDPDALRASIRAEVEAELRAQAQPAQPAVPAAPTPPQTIPTSLAESQSSRASVAAPGAPPTLNDILGRN